MQVARESDNAVKRFLLPEKEVSLKLLFDNARNYVIVGAFVAMARWLEKGKANAVPDVFSGAPATGWKELMWLCLTIALVLFMLNLGQSVVIGRRMLKMLTGADSAEPGQPGLSAAPWYVRILVWTLAAVLTFVVLATGALLLLLAIYMVWYTAVGAGR
jgi:hypothetical protein